jgi:DedD protein
VKTKPAAEAKPAETTRAKGSRILLQAAALSTDAAAQDLSERLRKAGFAPFTEKVDTADGVRFRVRVGPYATRDEAQRAQARLRALGVSATLVTT